MQFVLYLVCLFAFLSKCEAHHGSACSIQSGYGWKFGCFYEGKIMSFGSAMKNGCTKCRCVDRESLECCESGLRITYNPPDCEVVHNGCSDKAVRKLDHNYICTQDIRALLLN